MSVSQILKLTLVIVLVATFPAQSRDLTKALATCEKISSKTDKQLCFDAVELVNQTNKASPNTEQQARLTKQEIVKELKQQEFGLNSLSGVPSKTSGTIKKVKKNPYGKFTIYLEQGQVWKQKDSSKLKLKKGDQIIIEKAALGSFVLSTEKSSRKMRVKRVK